LASIDYFILADLNFCAEGILTYDDDMCFFHVEEALIQYDISIGKFMECQII